MCVLLVNFNGGSFSAIFALTSYSSIFCIVLFLQTILQTIKPYGMETFLCLLFFIRTNIFLCNVERFLSPSFILKFLFRTRLTFWSRHFEIWNQNFLRNFWNFCLLISFNFFLIKLLLLLFWLLHLLFRTILCHNYEFSTIFFQNIVCFLGIYCSFQLKPVETLLKLIITGSRSWFLLLVKNMLQKNHNKFFIKDFLSKCVQICTKP